MPALTASHTFPDLTSDAITVARDLLGMILVRIVYGRRVCGMIVETEAYMGPADRSAHSYGGRRTQRNESMYLPGGCSYVYFIYGMHHCFNVVCADRNEPQAVLVRALEPREGIGFMRARRSTGVNGRTGRRTLRDRDLCSGPAKLTEAMAIDRRLDGIDLMKSRELFLEPGDAIVRPSQVASSPRIGIDYAGTWADKPWRFFIRGNEHVSR